MPMNVEVWHDLPLSDAAKYTSDNSQDPNPLVEGSMIDHTAVLFYIMGGRTLSVYDDCFLNAKDILPAATGAEIPLYDSFTSAIA